MDGLAHVRALNQHDMFLLQGWTHAEDRLFQMDVNRRQPSGTLAELLGPGALASDVQLRTIGLRRAAERSWAATLDDAAQGDRTARRVKAAMFAYAEGVNAYVDAGGGVLPPEYGALGLSAFEPWSPVDSIVIGKLIAFGLSFDLEDIDNTQTLGAFQDELGEQAGYLLFSEDLYRSAPFDPASTVPDAGSSGSGHPHKKQGQGKAKSAKNAPKVHPDAARLSRGISAQGAAGTVVEETDRKRALRPRVQPLGRSWGQVRHRVSDHRQRSASVAGQPDDLLSDADQLAGIRLPWAMVSPARRLSSPGRTGISPGARPPTPWTSRMYSWIRWSRIRRPRWVSASRFLTADSGPVVPVPESYFVNIGGVVLPAPPDPDIPPFTLTVPARYDGVILEVLGDLAPGGFVLTAQYTGFGPTRELETFYLWNKARDLDDFRDGLTRFDFGSAKLGLRGSPRQPGLFHQRRDADPHRPRAVGRGRRRATFLYPPGRPGSASVAAAAE